MARMSNVSLMQRVDFASRAASHTRRELAIPLITMNGIDDVREGTCAVQCGKVASAQEATVPNGHTVARVVPAVHNALHKPEVCAC
jgi:hypothetical protein